MPHAAKILDWGVYDLNVPAVVAVVASRSEAETQAAEGDNLVVVSLHSHPKKTPKANRQKPFVKARPGQPVQAVEEAG